MDMMMVDLRPVMTEAQSKVHLYPKIGDAVVLWGENLSIE
jgi:alanine racemase